MAAATAGGRAAYADALVDGVAEAVCVAGDELPDAVDALAGGVGDTGVDKRFDGWPPLLDGGGRACSSGSSLAAHQW